MKHTETITIEWNLKVLNYFKLSLEQSLFFDIETTGFTANTSMLYLIGAIYFNQKEHTFQITQWFNETGTIEEEKELLKEFFTFAANYRTLIHFNGDSFDIPYLSTCAKQHHIPNTLPRLTSFDIYKKIRPLKKPLCLLSLKQKSIEQYMAIKRKDTKDGGELINVYKEYIQTRSSQLLKLLLLHNADDIKGMLSILPILHYIPLADGAFTTGQLKLQGNYATIPLHLAYPLIKPLNLSKNNYLLTARDDTALLQIPTLKGELKYFYPNYKDYYYLPLEDTAIHKSVAFFVDKQYRTQAKASNCYSRKSGLFLPQPQPVIAPVFKQDYKDNITYLNIDDEDGLNQEELKCYCQSLLHYLFTLQ